MLETGIIMDTEVYQSIEMSKKIVIPVLGSIDLKAWRRVWG